MSISTEIDAAAWTAKHALYLIGGLLVLAMAAFVIYRVFVAPGEAKRAIAVEHATGAINSGGAASAHDAVQAVAGNAIHETTVHDTVRIEHDTIIRTPGADAPVSDQLDAGGRAAVCMLISAPGCPGRQ